VGIHLVRLADGTAGDKTADERVQPRPPKVPGHEVLDSENAAVTTCGRLMERGDNVMADPLWHVEEPLEVKCPFLTEPVRPLGARKEGHSLVEGLEGGENKGVRGGGQGDLVHEGDIDGTSEEVIREECEFLIVVSCVDVVMVGEGVGGAHLCSRGMEEVQVKVLQEQIPMSLSAGQRVRLPEVREVFMVR
jgi:hypothetical protein